MQATLHTLWKAWFVGVIESGSLRDGRYRNVDKALVIKRDGDTEYGRIPCPWYVGCGWTMIGYRGRTSPLNHRGRVRQQSKGNTWHVFPTNTWWVKLRLTSVNQESCWTYIYIYVCMYCYLWLIRVIGFYSIIFSTVCIVPPITGCRHTRTTTLTAYVVAS